MTIWTAQSIKHARSSSETYRRLKSTIKNSSRPLELRNFEIEQGASLPQENISSIADDAILHNQYKFWFALNHMDFILSNPHLAGKNTYFIHPKRQITKIDSQAWLVSGPKKPNPYLFIDSFSYNLQEPETLIERVSSIISNYTPPITDFTLYLDPNIQIPDVVSRKIISLIGREPKDIIDFFEENDRINRSLFAA
jgi:hypothetical protein